MAVKCAGRKYVSIGRLGEWRPCQNSGKVEREGKMYCRIHDPVTRKEKQEASYASYRQQADRQWKRESHKNASARFCEGVDTEIIETFIANGETMKKWMGER